MITGMTGYGSAQVSSGKIKGIVEIKSQNHRYFDPVFYLPSGLSAFEDKIRQVLGKQIRRGRVSVAIKITERAAQTITVSDEAVRQYLKYARQLKKKYNFKDTLTLSDLIRLPGVAEAREEAVAAEKIWPAVEKSLKAALGSLLTMRRREGKALSRDIASVLRRMLVQTGKIGKRAKALVRQKKNELTSDEFVSFQKGCDVNEEIIRLTHYIEEFKLLLRAPESVGKKLDFIAQEMQRETNTIGSKLQDKVVVNSVIALKSKIEKLREQAQNIE